MGHIFLMIDKENSMKKSFYCLVAGSALLLSGAAQAISVNGQAGKNFTNFEAGLGTETSGLYSTLNWAHSDNDGDIVGLGLGLGAPLGSAIISVGGKAMYLNPKHSGGGSDDYAVAIGGGINLPLGQSFALYGSAYYSPDSLSSGIKDYTEATGGVRWNVMRPLSVDVGYRYVNLAGKDGHRDNAIADGPYVGVGLSF